MSINRKSQPVYTPAHPSVPCPPHDPRTHTADRPGLPSGSKVLVNHPREVVRRPGAAKGK
jgi:hypothetical protein